MSPPRLPLTKGFTILKLNLKLPAMTNSHHYVED